MTLSKIELWIKILSSIIAAGGVLVASFKALTEWRRATEQRQEELQQRQREFRHKQATFARDLTKEVFSDPKSRAALKMLDWLNAEYLDDNASTYHIRRDDLQFALRTNSLDFSDKEKFIRTRFEALYDYLEQIERLIELDVINFDDIETTFRYYLVRAIRPTIRHFEFLEKYDYPLAKKFLGRFEGKEKTSNKTDFATFG